ncbi:isoquinoline 1-oxidoreductase beta subunit [Roseateles toxinivorans]|uniref:Isoquinoline 1-oxidoreductase beta subunit n=2 Tax=Roseateles toxinivorans TaxID=270368 RepID=A0A4R6QFP0_9BURK|nr:isoquinoline 1-oxidoreductase beta subunit [Roseateles toxinivorans]
MRRREWLKSSFALGAWTLGGVLPVAALAQGAAPPAPAAAPGFAVWLRFAPDGRLTVLSNVVEMGQGTHTSVAQIAAEELDLPLAAISVAQAPVEPAFAGATLGNYASFGSLGLPLSYRELAPVCAAARHLLMQAAAQRWGVAPEACRTAEAQVVHPDGLQRLPYAQLLAEAAGLTPPAGIKPKPRAEWKVMGRSTPRRDLAAKVDGSAVFGIDVKRPGMLIATLLHAPRFGAELLSLDERPARAIKGVRQVVRLPGVIKGAAKGTAAIAVVADSYWTARKGLLALKPSWSDGPHAGTDSEVLRTELLAAAARGQGLDFDKRDDPLMDPPAVTAALASARQTLDISYDVPYLAHATMEPMNAVAEVGRDGAALWLSTQSAQDTQAGVAKALGLKPAQVTVHPQLIGGGFGRRLEHGFAIEAALVAKAVGKPVQLIWSRETDMRAGGYRPAAAVRVRLALGADGLPTGLRVDGANPSLLAYSGLTNGPPNPELDWTMGMGWTRHDYAVPALHLNWTNVDPGVPCGYWRSVGASQNVFFYECSLDRAAALAGIDPLDYRLRLLAKKPQTQQLLRALAERAGWGQPLPAGSYRGLAMSAGNAARSAHVVQLTVLGEGRFRIDKIFAAIDVGVVVNPDAVQAQMMGGTLFGLSAALNGEVTLKQGAVQQGNFDGYPIVTLAQTPPLDVLVLGNGKGMRGAGEEGPASIGPAIANALFAATGRPVTRLPLSRAGWQLVS